jgi:hypothetical protein
MALGIDSASNTEYQRYFFWGGGGKGGPSLRLASLPPSYADCLEILGASTSWGPKDLYKYCFAFKAARVKGMVMLTVLYISHFPT